MKIQHTVDDVMRALKAFDAAVCDYWQVRIECLPWQTRNAAFDELVDAARALADLGDAAPERVSWLTAAAADIPEEGLLIGATAVSTALIALMGEAGCESAVGDES